LALWLFCWHVNNKELNWFESLLGFLWLNTPTRA
jgi:hypothetical protein